jgi:hypothetical protein
MHKQNTLLHCHNSPAPYIIRLIAVEVQHLKIDTSSAENRLGGMGSFFLLSFIHDSNIYKGFMDGWVGGGGATLRTTIQVKEFHKQFT